MPGWSASAKQARVASRSSSRACRCGSRHYRCRAAGWQRRRGRPSAGPANRGRSAGTVSARRSFLFQSGKASRRARLASSSRPSRLMSSSPCSSARAVSRYRPRSSSAFQLFQVSGADAADVADGQHRQQVQPLLGLHRLGEIPHRARIGDIALLRHVRHQQVIPHQPFDGIAFLWLQAQPRTDLARDLCAQNRVILCPPLADVVQQQRDIKNLAVHALFQDATGNRQRLRAVLPARSAPRSRCTE